MPRQDDEKFSNRLDTAAKARAEMLAKAKARAEAAKANFAAKAGERIALAAAREERQKKRAEEKRLAAIEAEKQRVLAEQARIKAEEEAKIQAELEQISADRTTLTIAHRLSTVVAADCIYVMERGRVVERGRHAELLAGNGVYARLYAQQFVNEAEAPPMREAVV